MCLIIYNTNSTVSTTLSYKLSGLIVLVNGVLRLSRGDLLPRRRRGGGLKTRL